MLKDLIVFQKAYELLKWLHTLAAKFPKSEKFVLAQKLENSALELLEAIIEANAVLNKTVALNRASLALEKTRIWLRVAFELRYVALKQYETGSRMLDELGRLLGGWCRRFAGGKEIRPAGAPADKRPDGGDAPKSAVPEGSPK